MQSNQPVQPLARKQFTPTAPWVCPWRFMAIHWPFGSQLTTPAVRIGLSYVGIILMLARFNRCGNRPVDWRVIRSLAYTGGTT
ncbi:MAG: hypothetical protein CM15mP120_20420 [Pseudomonadota bacterium]|nr:MAG: hypothetical protein CM15mP120_20420 [Pseudomonadota bacterium]